MKPFAKLPYGLFFLILVVEINLNGQEPKRQKVEIEDGIELHFVENGSGEPVIFIHGILGDYTVWTKQLESFANAGYRAIAYSRRHNFPNDNPIRANHSAALEADDLASFVRKLKLKKVHVVGFSYGAYTALFFSLKYPDLIHSVTLAEPPIAPWLSDLRGDQSGLAKDQLSKLLNQGVKPAKKAMRSNAEKLAIKTMVDCIGGTGKYESLPEFVKSNCQRNVNELKAFLASDDRYPNIDREQVRRSKIPTLIISGSKSVATAKFTDPELERLLPKKTCKRVIFKDATHIMWIEKPVLFRKSILDFIR